MRPTNYIRLLTPALMASLADIQPIQTATVRTSKSLNSTKKGPGRQHRQGKTYDQYATALLPDSIQLFDYLVANVGRRLADVIWRQTGPHGRTFETIDREIEGWNSFVDIAEAA